MFSLRDVLFLSVLFSKSRVTDDVVFCDLFFDSVSSNVTLHWVSRYDDDW